MIFTNAQLILPDAIQPGSLILRNGRIASVSRAKKSNSSKSSIDLRGGYLAPGFIDLHIHGALSRDTMEATADAFRTITEFHLRGGTTSIALTTLTAPEQEILRVLEAVKFVHNQSLGGARIVGVHIEGPFISKEKPGAQNPKQIRPPRESEWKKYLRYGSLVTEMTLAPEVAGALPLIRALKRNGTIVSGGHTNATEEELGPALAAGLNHATHTFNAMSTATKRGPYRVAGMVEFALAHPEICCELIADGVHVAPTLMRMLFNAKGRDGVCLITDATGGAGLKPGRTFEIAGIAARVTSEAALTADGSALAGSTLTMIEAVRRAVQLGGASLVDAVRMASLNPARQLRRDRELGSIERGKRADLVWFDEQFRVRGVWLDGDVRFLA
ncbi:MAG TPA: N-acetylglucosamine-6-phosphate deacetylase [Verrucomicrobiae bacterium]|jgi:N-acetylglucosamine-6-phosphate deacetylase